MPKRKVEKKHFTLVTIMRLWVCLLPFRQVGVWTEALLRLARRSRGLFQGICYFLESSSLRATALYPESIGRSTREAGGRPFKRIVLAPISALFVHRDASAKTERPVKAGGHAMKTYIFLSTSFTPHPINSSVGGLFLLSRHLSSEICWYRVLRGHSFFRV